MNAEYSNLIKHRRIAIVGGYDEHDSIDRYDTIVRVNSHWFRQGGKCDIIYHNGGRRDWDSSRSRKFYLMPELKQLKFMVIDHAGGVRSDMIDFCTEHEIPYMTYRKDLKYSSWTPWARELVSRVQEHSTRSGDPFTGTAAAMHISRYPILELFITGMSLYSNVKPEEFNPGLKAHDPYANGMFLEDLAKHDDRITLGSDLKEGIEWVKKNKELVQL